MGHLNHVYLQNFYKKITWKNTGAYDLPACNKNQMFLAQFVEYQELSDVFKSEFLMFYEKPIEDQIHHPNRQRSQERLDYY